MKIAIHSRKGSFSDRWIEYCISNNLNYKLVNCYSSNIIQQLSDCDALMWHFSQNSVKDILFAKQLILAVEATGIKVFPNYHTSWHFDDKLGQKYLLESIDAPLAPVWIFYDRDEAFQWAKGADFPKVFKLRGGAGSQNVRLVHSRKEAAKFISKSFGQGFLYYSPISSLKERWRKYNLGKTNFRDLVEGLIRFVILPPYAKIRGREKGYVYFQEFIPGNDHDIRVVVIGDKAFALQRMVRKNDFRASGSGNLLYDRHLFDEKTILLSFDIASKINSQCVALDYVYQNNNPLVVEISFGFSPEAYDLCHGYWDKNFIWHEGKFNPYGWMVESILEA